MAITCDYCNSILGITFYVEYTKKQQFYKCPACKNAKVEQPILDKKNLPKPSDKPSN